MGTWRKCYLFPACPKFQFPTKCAKTKALLKGLDHKCHYTVAVWMRFSHTNFFPQLRPKKYTFPTDYWGPLAMLQVWRPWLLAKSVFSFHLLQVTLIHLCHWTKVEWGAHQVKCLASRQQVIPPLRLNWINTFHIKQKAKTTAIPEHFLWRYTC